MKSLRVAAGWGVWPLRRRCRVPVRLQSTTTDCGAACLAMVMSHLGRESFLGDCLADLPVGRDGTSARDFVDAAAANGLRARVYSAEPRALRQLSMPLIVHWSFNHFVVVESWSPQRVIGVDPARGRFSMSAAEFEAGYTGITLSFEPTEQFQKRRSAFRPRWGRLAVYLQGRKGLVAQILGVSLGLQILGLGAAWVARILVDDVLPRDLRFAMPAMALGIALLVAAQAVATWLRALMLADLQVRVDISMMHDVMTRIMALPYRWFAQRSAADVLSRLNCAQAVRDITTAEALGFAIDGVLVIGYLAVLVIQVPVSGILVLGVGMLHLALLAVSVGPVFSRSQAALVAESDARACLVEAAVSMETVKASASEVHVLRRWTRLFGREMQAVQSRARLLAMIDAAQAAVSMAAPLALLLVGGLQVMAGEMTLGTMLAINAIAYSVLLPLASAADRVQRLYMAAAHFQRIAEVFDSPAEAPPEAVQLSRRLLGRIDVDSVSFGFSPRAAPILQEVGFSVAPGEKVAIVGTSGSGKSTLMRLLLGLIDPIGGVIRYDGMPLSSFDARSLRAQIGTVLQDVALLQGSIRENIAWHRADATLDAVCAAARAVGMHDEIERMPMGYETLVTGQSGGLSGGQRQRIAIARALLQRPAVLLLDEATSHLDVLSERHIEQALNALGCSRIVIAHRLSTVRNADLILVLADGRIVERGTHESLLASGGRYAEMVRAQTDP